MVKKSTQVALGGLTASLCLLLMFLTAVLPFATFALPALAGIVLVGVVLENGYPTAVLVYVAVCILGAIVVPDKEAVMMFVAFFGYYPILKGKLEKIRFRVVEYVVKFALFNVAIVVAYLIIINVFGMREILEETGMFGAYSLLILWGMGNLVFGVYDFALTRIIDVYVHVFRPRILRKMR